MDYMRRGCQTNEHVFQKKLELKPALPFNIDMKYFEFSNGDKIPALGLGTWQAEPEKVYDAVIHALKVGYRHLDCAYVYHNEEVIGRAIADAIKSGLVTRDELFVTSKLWNSEHDPKDVEPAIRSTLKDLGLDYVNLYLMHWPIASQRGEDMPSDPSKFIPLDKMPIEKTWAAMEELKTKGLAKHIGVSNFSVSKLKDLFGKCKTRPEMNQIELHPYLQQTKLVDFCLGSGLLVTAYSPLGTAASIKNLAADPAIVEIAKNHNCEPLQIVLAWNIERGVIVIPKSVHAERITENLKAADIDLTAAEMEKVAELDKGLRENPADIFTIPGSPYTQENLWS